ncbi:MAG TPA: helix-turn-helix domain-containing protein [Chloroflexota bacterium]|jgi:DNA-binding HxlR family transcriptional regulator
MAQRRESVGATADAAAGVSAAAGATTDPGAGARRSVCPVACTLDIVGDRWTLLVIRDLLHGKRRYADFAASPERIPTNILADRLRRLEREGVIRRVRYSEHPPRDEYLLTEEGHELGRVNDALAAWGLKHFPGTARRLGRGLGADAPPDAADSAGEAEG